MNKIKVLIIDDSALTRSVLKEIINQHKDFEVVGTAIDPIIAARKIQKFKPDIITLDLLMPRMDGLTFLKKLMKSSPLPTIVISGNSPKSSQNAIKALDLGAVDIIEKPDISTPDKLREVTDRIHNSIKAAFSAGGHFKKEQKEIIVNKIISAPIIRKEVEPVIKKRQLVSKEFFVIGASTGGPQALKAILQGITSFSNGIVIAQHMPAMFTKSFADRLNDECDINVVEATNGEQIENGKAMIIPGDFHGEVKRNDSGFFISLNQSEKVNRHRPSVDVLFKSAAKIAGKKSTGILLTGMGDDGARGLKNLIEVGSETVAQNEESCVVFGMPKRAIEMGGAKQILNPADIVYFINAKYNSR